MMMMKSLVVTSGWGTPLWFIGGKGEVLGIVEVEMFSSSELIIMFS